VSGTETHDGQKGALVKCETCHQPMGSPLFCDHCRSLYPADGLNHFELLGVTPEFDLDADRLRQGYLQVSRGIHPDQHGGAEDNSVSLHLSAQVNEAYRVLSDPVLRAEYLLELAGGLSAAQDKSVPQDVLTTALMLREETAEARASGDAAAAEACRARVTQVHDRTLAQISELARRSPGEPGVRQELRRVLNAMKYYQKLMADL
jgi:molecular chaperone HscB